jgi:hypothetical protein
MVRFVGFGVQERNICMKTDRDLARMRAAVGEGIGPIVRQLIALTREKNEWYFSPAATRGGTREHAHSAHLAASSALPGRIRPKSVEAFINSRPPRERAAFAALYLLGRDTMATTAADFEAVAETFVERPDTSRHLAGKGHLDSYLEKALSLLGL